jgi:uncharacterized delta-60 repeat protein
MRRRSALLSSFVLVTSVFAADAGAAPEAIGPGFPDPSFGGGDGYVVVDLDGFDYGADVVVRANGQIMVGGQTNGESEVAAGVLGAVVDAADFAILRLNGDGGVDTGYGGGDGWASVDIADDDIATGIHVLVNGKGLLTGFSYAAGTPGFAVARFTAAGAPDTTFSGDGVNRIVFPGKQAFSKQSVRMPSGKLVLAGYVVGGATGSDFGLARFKANGALDVTFSGDGRQTTSFGEDDGANGLIRLPNGKLVAVGWSNNEADGKVALVRYNPSGSLDTTFGGGDGKATANLDPGDPGEAGYRVVRLGSGKLVVLAYSKADFWLVRFNGNGTIDTTFGGGDGKVMFEAGDFGSWLNGFAVKNGKFIVVGHDGFGFDEFENDGWVMRFNGNGSPDTTFGGGDGFEPFDIAFESLEPFRELTIDPDGRIVVVGRTFAMDGSSSDVLVARYLSS